MTAQPRNVVYVALGPYRVRAAQRYTAALAAAGARVLLVTADQPEWGDVALADGVTRHLVSAADTRAVVRAAKRFLLGRGGRLRDADLLLAGDPHALPAIWDAAIRYPKLSVRLAPPDGSAARTEPTDLAVVTPWYPSANNALAGAFVKATVGAVRADFPRVSILHTEDWVYPYDALTAQAISVATERVAVRAGKPTVVDTELGEVTYVPVPISSERDYATWALAHVNAARDALPTGQIEAPVVHAHTGIYGGVVAARLARPDARVVVTEHSSFLRQVFKQPAARRLYEEALQRADVFLCVSDSLYNTVRDQFPHHEDKLRVVPNAIDFDDFTLRPEPPRDLLRWLYVGRLSEAKGVHTLFAAFVKVAAEEPHATLTMVGSGPLVDELRDRIRDSGLGDRIELRPAIAPHEVPGLMHAHDLLVHASPVETFGMTVVEAVATGTPVLVAASTGPQETLAGLNGTAGLLVEVSDDPDVIVEGYRELRKRLGELDVPAARAVLLDRYGRESVAARLREVYAPPVPTAAAVAGPAAATTTAAAGPAPALDPGAERVLLVAISPPNFNLVREFVHRLLGRGLAVDVITNDPGLWQRSAVDERVRLLPLDAAERRRPVLRAERLLVYRAPGKVLSVARDKARQRDALWPELAVSNLQRAHSRMAKSFHTSVFYGGYRVVRPRVLWRIVQHDILPKLDLSRTRRVVVSGVYGVAIGWQLARRHPELTVTTALVTPESTPS